MVYLCFTMVPSREIGWTWHVFDELPGWSGSVGFLWSPQLTLAAARCIGWLGATPSHVRDPHDMWNMWTPAFKGRTQRQPAEYMVSNRQLSDSHWLLLVINPLNSPSKTVLIDQQLFTTIDSHCPHESWYLFADNESLQLFNKKVFRSTTEQIYYNTTCSKSSTNDLRNFSQ